MLFFLFLNLFQIYSVLILGKEILTTNLLIVYLVLVACSKFLLRRCFIEVQTLFVMITIVFLLLISTTWQLVVDENMVGNFGRQSHSWLLTVSVSSIVWLLLGASLTRNLFRLNTFVIILLNVVLGIIFYLSVESLFRGIVFQVGNNVGGIQTFNHLYVSSSLIILIFFSTYSLQHSPLMLNLFFPIWALMLFLIQSRATLFIFVIVFFTLMLKTKNWQYIGMYLLQIFIYTVCVLIFIDTSMLSGRFSFSDGFLNDPSIRARIDGIFDVSSLTFKQFILGSVSDMVNITGGFGGYAHNYFSMVQIFGIFPFLAFPLIVNLKLYSNKGSLIDRNLFVWLIFMFSIISLLISQSIVYKLPWFAFGLLIGMKYDKRPV